MGSLLAALCSSSFLLVGDAHAQAHLSSTDASASWVSTIPGRVGEALSSADVTCDGVADLLTSDPNLGDYGRGQAYVLPGPVSGEVRRRDLVVLRNPEEMENAWFGQAMAGGDADGDGCADLLVDVPAAQHERGGGPPKTSTYLFLGPVTADRTKWNADAIVTAFSSYNVSTAVAISQDVDGDSAPDLLIHRPDNGDSGELYVTPGTLLGRARVEVEARYVFEGVRSTVLLADLDGDGIDDLVSRGADPVYVVAGGRPAGTYVFSDVADSTIGNGTSGNNYGTALASGDYDGDGATDLFVGEPGGYSSSGVRGGNVYGYLGPLGATVDNGDVFVRWESNDVDDDLTEYGALATGDANGDGHADVAMGTLFTPTADGQGRVYLGFGPASGVVDVSTVTSIEASEPAWWLGHTVAFVPDWDGDGGDELAVSAPATSDSIEVQGALYLFSSGLLD